MHTLNVNYSVSSRYLIGFTTSNSKSLLIKHISSEQLILNASGKRKRLFFSRQVRTNKHFSKWCHLVKAISSHHNLSEIRVKASSPHCFFVLLQVAFCSILGLNDCILIFFAVVLKKQNKHIWMHIFEQDGCGSGGEK